jgi:hypothetical protein
MGKDTEDGNKVHLVIEAHLQIDETILNPTRIGPAVAKKIAELLEEMYAVKGDSTDSNSARTRTKRTTKMVRQVHTLVVSHRTAEMTARLDTQE